MTADCKEHYRSILLRFGEIQTEVFSENAVLALFTANHNSLSDIERLVNTVSDRLEAQLMRLALREISFALFSASTGNFRYAYISTRMFLELMLGAVYFSAYEIKLRRWSNNLEDIVWSAIVDKDNGPFAKAFINAFSPQFTAFGPQYGALAEALYRECSEYVHGNASTHSDWNERIRTAKSVVMFAFISRYAASLSSESLSEIEEILLDEFGDNEAVRCLYC